MKRPFNVKILFALFFGIIIISACSQNEKHESTVKQQKAEKAKKLETLYKPIIIEGAAPTPQKENLLLLEEVDKSTLKSILESRISKLYSNIDEKAAVYVYRTMEQFEFSAALCIGSAVKKPGENVKFTLDYDPNMLKDYTREKTY